MSQAERWSAHINCQAKSGLSQAAYCRRHDLQPASFSQWKRRLREDSRETGFIALALPASSCRESADTTFRVLLGNGLELVLPLNVGRDQLTVVVTALKGL